MDNSSKKENSNATPFLKLLFTLTLLSLVPLRPRVAAHGPPSCDSASLTHFLPPLSHSLHVFAPSNAIFKNQPSRRFPGDTQKRLKVVEVGSRENVFFFCTAFLLKESCSSIEASFSRASFRLATRPTDHSLLLHSFSPARKERTNEGREDDQRRFLCRTVPTRFSPRYTNERSRFLGNVKVVLERQGLFLSLSMLRRIRTWCFE